MSWISLPFVLLLDEKFIFRCICVLLVFMDLKSFFFVCVRVCHSVLLN